MSILERWRTWQLKKYFDSKELRGSRGNRKDILFLLEKDNVVNKEVPLFMSKRPKLQYDILHFADTIAEGEIAVKKGSHLKILKQEEIVALFDIHYDYVISLYPQITPEQKLILRHYPQSIKIGQFPAENAPVDLNIMPNNKNTKLDLLAQIPYFIDQLKA